MCRFFSRFFCTGGSEKKLKWIFGLDCVAKKQESKTTQLKMQANYFYDLPEDVQLHIHFLAAKKIADFVNHIPTSRLMQRKAIVLDWLNYHRRCCNPPKQKLSTDDLLFCKEMALSPVNKLVGFLNTKGDYEMLQESCNVNRINYDDSWTGAKLVKALMCI